MSHRARKTPEKIKYMVFGGLGIMLITMGILFTPDPVRVVKGFAALIGARMLLDPNTFLMCDGAIGVPFINSGILTLLCLWSYVKTRTRIKGLQISAMMITMGFGFCGLTILNIWPVIFGALAYAKINHKDIRSELHIAWFACGLAPIFNIFAFYLRFDGPAGENFSISIIHFIIAVIISLAAGYGVALFTAVLPMKHRGYLLFNAGFASGIIAMLLHAILKSVGMGNTAPVYSFPNIANGPFAVCILIINLYFIICGFIITKDDGIKKILLKCDRDIDHVSAVGFGPAIFNIGVMGMVCFAYMVICGLPFAHGQIANISGPVFAALYTVAGTSANGATIKNALPLMGGVCLTGFLVGGIAGVIAGESFFRAAYTYIGTKSMVVSAIYSCGMSPVTGEFGILSGFLAGCMHCVLVPNTASLQGWLNLHNNGFCQGIVTTFYVHILEHFKTEKVVGEHKAPHPNTSAGMENAVGD